MDLAYRVYETDNVARGLPDLGRLQGLARRLAAQRLLALNIGIDDLLPGAFEAAVRDNVLRLTEAYDGFTHEERGVCGGWVCNWAYNYLTTNEPESPVTLDEARRLQGHDEMTLFKRTEAKKTKSVKSVARQKMYQSKYMSLTKVIKDGKFLEDFRFMRATTQMIDCIVQTPHAPFLLSVRPKGGGGHALGLLYHPPTYYFLDPNEGLFKFQTRQKALDEINKHFILKLAAKENWKLIKIDLDVGALIDGWL